MKVYETISLLIDELLEKDKSFSLKLHALWDNVEQANGDTIDKAFKRSLFTLVVNHQSANHLIYQSMVKAIKVYISR